jgi:hypothetical protein
MRRRAGFLAALAAAALLAACGAPDELDSDDDQRLSAARAELDDALDTEETIRTSPEMAASLTRRVRRLAARDDAEKLEEIVPSLVAPEGGIDQEAARNFVEFAPNDPERALLQPATLAVTEVENVVDDSGADGETKVPHARDAPLDRYLDQVERDIKDVWPALAAKVEELP